VRIVAMLFVVFPFKCRCYASSNQGIELLKRGE